MSLNIRISFPVGEPKTPNGSGSTEEIIVSKLMQEVVVQKRRMINAETIDTQKICPVLLFQLSQHLA